MRGPQLNSELPQKRPDHKLVALIADRHTMSAMVHELQELGLDVEQIVVLHGSEGLDRFDADGSHHGWWAHLRRTVKNVGGADANILNIYREGLEHGRFLVFVPVHEHSRRAGSVGVLRQHHAHAISFFTPGSMESIPSLER